MLGFLRFWFYCYNTLNFNKQYLYLIETTTFKPTVRSYFEWQIDNYVRSTTKHTQSALKIVERMSADLIQFACAQKYKSETNQNTK